MRFSWISRTRDFVIHGDAFGASFVLVFKGLIER